MRERWRRDVLVPDHNCALVCAGARGEPVMTWKCIHEERGGRQAGRPPPPPFSWQSRLVQDNPLDRGRAGLEKLSTSRRSKCSPDRGSERLARRAVAQSPPFLECVFAAAAERLFSFSLTRAFEGGHRTIFSEVISTESFSFSFFFVWETWRCQQKTEFYPHTRRFRYDINKTDLFIAFWTYIICDVIN